MELLSVICRWPLRDQLSICEIARSWKDHQQREQQTTGRGTFIPLVFQPGEAFQFDWSEDWAVIGGERVKLQAAHFKLS